MAQPQKQSSCYTNPLNEEARPETEVLSSLHETMAYIQQGDRHASVRQMHSRGCEKLVCEDQLRAWGPLWR